MLVSGSKRQAASEPSTFRYVDARKIYNLKLQHVALILILVALVFYWVESKTGSPSQDDDFWSSLIEEIPFHSLADAILTIAVVALAFEYFVRQEAQTQLTELVRQEAQRERSALINEIASIVLSKPETLLSSLSKAKLHQVINSGLAITLGDKQLANELYDGLLRTIGEFKERWIETHHTVTLTRVDDNESKSVQSAYYQAYVTLRYQTILKRKAFEFRCISSKQVYDDAIWDGLDIFYLWLMYPSEAFPRPSRACFDVTGMSVNGIPLSIDMFENLEFTSHSLCFTCHSPRLASLQGKLVTIEARFKVKVPKNRHQVNLWVPFPSRGMFVEVDYGDTDIARMVVCDMFVSRQRPDIRLLPTPERPRRIEVEVDEWVFPRGGSVFVWQLNGETYVNNSAP